MPAQSNERIDRSIGLSGLVVGELVAVFIDNAVLPKRFNKVVATQLQPRRGLRLSSRSFSRRISCLRLSLDGSRTDSIRHDL